MQTTVFRNNRGLVYLIFPQKPSLGMLEQSASPHQSPLITQYQPVYNQPMSTPQPHTSNQGYGSYAEPQECVGIGSFRSISPGSGRPLSSCLSTSSNSSASVSAFDGQVLDAWNYHQL